MRPISSSNRPNSDSEAHSEAGGFTEPFTGKNEYKDLISKANAVPLTIVFKYYGLRLDECNRKIICPFKSHNGGRENSASFNFYPQTNTFWCFGCKTGPGAVDFVSEIEEIGKIQAANKILDIFSSDIDEDNILDRENYSLKLEIMLEFSSIVRDFRAKYNSSKSFSYIENICSVFDSLNLKHNLNNDALKHVVSKLKEQILSYHE